ncbi:hypothetical protein [Ramlibacter sp.]|jgi:hypothetical protein|uniref:hypothetical protein n=1 Tax=Ramlibacter sp. TaxID=1917967 RepID=UPI002FC7C532|nr:hypothetical protein [Ramlibacter sp.]MCE3270012.1 hypothetical protein [Ramlibacter sp.]
MSQQALIRGEVCFRAGDGVLVPIPDGPVSIDLADDSVTLGWEDEPGNAMSAALTRDEFDRYVKEGKIRIQGQ